MIPQTLYERLRELARSRDLAIYSQLAPLARIDPHDPLFAVHLGDLLDEVDLIEHAATRPLLSAVAIAEARNKPGPGIFDLARELGLHTGLDYDLFWVKEINRVYGWWSRH